MTKVTEEELILRSQYPRVTFVDVQQSIKGYKFRHEGLKVLCEMELINGFQITGESACAVPGNWKKDVGERLALEDATRKIWAFLGFELKSQVYLVQELLNKRICPAPGYKSYVTTEAVWANELSRGDYNDYRGWTIPEDEDPLDEGYLVVRDGHQTWIPKDKFEDTYKAIDLLGDGSQGGPTHVDRMQIELAELDDRITKLCVFMDTDTFKHLPQAKRELMEHQLDAMNAYCSSLNSRITLETL